MEKSPRRIDSSTRETKKIARSVCVIVGNENLHGDRPLESVQDDSEEEGERFGGVWCASMEEIVALFVIVAFTHQQWLISSFCTLHSWTDVQNHIWGGTEMEANDGIGFSRRRTPPGMPPAVKVTSLL